jgi:exodeoxyribonuclease V alpha subunit
MSETARLTPDIEPLTEIDRHFANWMVNLSSGASADVLEALWFAAALASNAVSRGDVCVLLSDRAGRPVDVHQQPGGNLLSERDTLPETYPDLLQWIDRLKRASVVGVPGEFRP